MAPAADGKVTGLLAATFTPFTAQGEVNLSVIGPYVDYLTEKQGVKGIFVNGTTGESMSLSVAERKLLAEEWCQRAKGRMDNVIVHAGCMSLKDSQELQLLAALAMGANGAVGSTYNYIGRYVNQLISAFETGDLVRARTIQFKVQELLGYAIKLGFDIGVNKQLMAEVSGLFLGPPRLPLMPCSPAHAQLIAQKYHSIFV
ncbi:hypothetical protein CRENBAI_007879 [Crenichthys baileyi]|uniref:N-acetylneuraminate lyase n=1 Tax=Crenichthys baileyi TaxID=28760 RepID=A0AAV9RV95_9TELE